MRKDIQDISRILLVVSSLFNQSVNNWMGRTPQTDDITVVGVKLK